MTRNPKVYHFFILIIIKKAFDTAKLDVKAILQDRNVTFGVVYMKRQWLININKVMAAQTDLVDVIAKFELKKVRMADNGSWDD